MSETTIDAKQSFFTALAAVQGELKGAKKDSKNPHFKNRYADLESVWDAWSLVGPRHGFSIIQKVSDAGETRNGVIIRTLLAHSSGHVEESSTYVPANKADAQGYGSAITYGRRYSLAAMVGIVQTDDDGEAARKASEPDVSALKKWAEDAYQKKDVAGLKRLMDMPPVQAHSGLKTGIQKRIDELENA